MSDASTYISNHDHSHVTWQAGARANRQEFGEDHWIPEQDDGTGRRVRPRPLRWKLSNDSIGKSLFHLYKRLIEIRKQYPGLRSRNFYPDYWEEWQSRFNPAGFGVDTQRQVVIYHRWGNTADGRLEKFYIILSFSQWPQAVEITFPEDDGWIDLLSGWRPSVQNNRLRFEVGSNWGHVFYKKY